MKTITIRLPDVEAAMLLEVQKKSQKYRNIENLLIKTIRDEYRRISGEA